MAQAKWLSMVLALLTAAPALAQLTDDSAGLKETQAKADAVDGESDEPLNTFKGAQLFLNQSMKFDVGRTFGVGLNFTIAPVTAAKKTLIRKLNDQFPEETEVVRNAMQHIPPEALDTITSKQGLLDEIKSRAPLSAEDSAKLDQAFEKFPEQELNTVKEVLKEITDNPDTTVTYSLEPYFSLYFDFMDIRILLPMAGFVGEGDTNEFAFGNIGAELKFGHHFGDPFAFGISYGVNYWVPTATEKANALGLANLLWAPKYLHEYTTIQPFVVLGADLMFVQIQASLAYTQMFAVKGEPDYDQVGYLQYGASVAVTAIPYIVISAELTGLHGVTNAAAYNSLVITSGLRVTASIVNIGLAFQVPLVQSEPSDLASLSDLEFGGPSTFNALLTLEVGF